MGAAGAGRGAGRGGGWARRCPRRAVAPQAQLPLKQTRPLPGLLLLLLLLLTEPPSASAQAGPSSEQSPAILALSAENKPAPLSEPGGTLFTAHSLSGKRAV